MAHTYSVVIQADTTKVETALEKALKNAGQIKGNADFSQVKSELEKIKREFSQLKLDDINIQTIQNQPIKDLKITLEDINNLIGKINNPQDSFVWITNLSNQLKDLEGQLQNAANLRKQISGNSSSDTTGKDLNALSKAYKSVKQNIDGSTSEYLGKNKSVQDMVSDIQQMDSETVKLKGNIESAFKSLNSLSAPQLTSLLKDLTSLQTLLDKMDDAVSQLSVKDLDAFKPFEDMDFDQSNVIKQMKQAMERASSVYSSLSKGQDINSVVKQVENVNSPLRTISLPLDVTISLENIEAQVLHAVDRAEQIVKNRKILLNIQAKKISVTSNIEKVKSTIKSDLNEIKGYFSELTNKDFRIPEITGIDNLKTVAETIVHLRKLQKDVEKETGTTVPLNGDAPQDITKVDTITKKEQSTKKQTSKKTTTKTGAKKGTDNGVGNGTPLTIDATVKIAIENLTTLKTRISEINDLTIEPKGIDNLKNIADYAKLGAEALKTVLESAESNTDSKKEVSTDPSQFDTLKQGAQKLMGSIISLPESFTQLLGLTKELQETINNISFSNMEQSIQSITNKLTPLVDTLLKLYSDDYQQEALWGDISKSFIKLTGGNESIGDMRTAGNKETKAKLSEMYKQYVVSGGGNRLEDLKYKSGKDISNADLKKLSKGIDIPTVSQQTVENTKEASAASQQWLDTLTKIEQALETITTSLQDILTQSNNSNASKNQPTSTPQDLSYKKDLKSAITGGGKYLAQLNASDFSAKTENYLVNASNYSKDLESYISKLRSYDNKNVITTEDIIDIQQIIAEINVLEEKIKELLSSSTYNTTNKQGALIDGTEHITDINKLKTYVESNVIGNNQQIKNLEISTELNEISGAFKDASGAVTTFTVALDEMGQGVRIKSKLIEDSDAVKKYTQEVETAAKITESLNKADSLIGNISGLVSIPADQSDKTDAYYTKLNNYKAQVQSIQNEIEKIKATPTTDENSLKDLQKYIGQLQTINEYIKQIQRGSAYNSINSKGKFLKGSEGITNIDQLKTFTTSNTFLGSNELIGNLKVNLNSISGAFKTTNGEVVKFKNTLDSTNNGVRATFNTITQEGIGGLQRFTNTLSSSGKQLLTMVGTYRLAQMAFTQLREAWSFFKEMDSSLNTISLTMDITSSKLNELGSAAIRMAQDVGTTVDQVTGVAEIYANMNETVDSILEKAQPTVLLSNASGLDVSTAADVVQGVVQQYTELEGQEEHVVDSLEKVSASMKMNFGEGIEAMSTALKKSGSIAREAGISYEQLIGITGKIAEVTRESGEVVGNSVKTIFSRLGRVTDDSEDALSASEVSNIAKAYKSIGINVYNADGSFVDADETLSKLAETWDTLTDAQRSYIAEQSSGVRQKNTFFIMMDNYKEAMEFANQAENSEGFSEEVQEKYAQSVQAKLNSMKATLQETFYGLFDGDQTKGILSFLQTLLDLLNKVNSVSGSLGTAFAVLNGYMSLKGGGLVNYNKESGTLSTIFSKGTKSYSDDFVEMSNHLLSDNFAKSQNKDAFINAVASSYGASTEQINALIGAFGDKEAVGNINDIADALKGVKATAGQTASGIQMFSQESSSAFNSLASVGKAAFASLASAGIALVASMVVQAAVKAIDKLIVTEKEAAEAAQEAQSAISDATNTYTNANKTVDEYLETYTRLGEGVKVVGNEIQNVSLTDSEFDEFLEANNALGEAFPEIVAGADAEGNSLLTLSTNATTAADSIQALIDVYKKAQIETIKDNWKDLYTGAKKAAEEYENDRAIASAKKGNLAAIAGTGYVVDKDSRQKVGGRNGNTITYAAGEYMGETGIEAQEFFEDAIKKYNGESSQVTTDYGTAITYTFDFESEDEIEEFEKELEDATGVQQKYAEASIDVADAQDKVDSEMKTLIPTLSTMMSAESGFSNLSDNMQNGVLSFVSNLSSSQLSAIGSDPDDMQAWVDKVYGRFTQNKGLYTELFDLESLKEEGNLTVQEYLDQRDEIIEKIGRAEGRDTEEIEIELGYKIKNEDTDEAEDEIKKNIEKTAKILSDKGSQVTEEDLYGLSYEDFEIVYSLVNEGETFDDVQSMMDAIEAQSIEIDVTTKLEDITNLKDIITEAAGNTGLTSESISTLKSMYADLYGDDGEKMYDALEFTSQGIRLNTDEILAFQEAQETVTKSNYMRQLSSLNSKYLEAADAISKLNHETEATSTELSGLKRQGDLSWWKTRADSLSDQIKSLRQAAAQFDGATSGYAKYQNALETPNEGATYEGAYTAIANAKKLYDNGDVGTDDFKTYVSMMTGISTSAPIEQIVQKYEASLGTIARYFTENAQGVVNFIADLDTLDDRIVTVQKDASGDIIGFDIKDDQQAADALGISLEALQMILYELRDKGWDVDIDDSTFLEKIANMQAAAIENQSLMQDLLEKNNYNVELNYTSNNVDDVVNQLNTVQSMRKAMVNEDGTIKVGVSQTDLDLVNQSLVALESQRYELTKPAIMDVDIDASTVSTQMADVLRVIQSYQTLAEQRQMTLMIGGDTSQIDKQMEEALTRFDELDIGTVTATLGMKTTDGTVVQNSSDFVNWFNNFGSGSIKLPTGVVSAENEDEVTPIEFETNVDSTKVDELFEKVDGEHIINFTTSVNGKKGVSSVFSSMAQTAKDASNKRLKEQNERANHSWKPEWNKTSDKTSSTKTTNTQITKYETKGAPSAIKSATQVSTAIKTVPLSRVSAFSTSGQKTVSSTASTLKEKLFSIPTSIASAISISVTGQEKLNTFTASLRTAVSRIQEYARAKAKGGLVNGTAHAFGTAFSEGSAFAHGDWSVHTNQTALVGELGREIIVRNGKWFSVGDNGAEFTSLRKGDIVFNNRQAEELLSKGYVTSNGGRGRAYVEGTAYSSGSGKFYGGAAKLKSTSKKVSTNRVNQAVNSAAQATTDFLDSLSSYFDFVEIKMTRLKSNTQRAISAIETAVSLAGAQQANAEALSKTQTELEYAQEAYQRYLSHANWIAQQTGLNAAYQSYIQNGRTDIVKFPENEQKAIDAYKEYWDKAEEVLDTIAELQEQEKELALQRLEIITEYYEAQSDNYDSNADMKSSSLEASKAQGKESSDVYYNTYSSMAVDYGNALSILQAEAENYQEEFNDLMERGYIVAGSTEYYEKLSEINDINEKVNDMLVKQLEALEDKYEATATFNEHLIDRLAETVDRYEAAIDLWETRGGEGNPDYFDSITSRYREEMLVNQEQIDRLSESIQSKYLALRKLGYEVGSEAYDNLVKEIEELEKKQLDLMTNNEEIIDSIREIRWTPFEQAQEEISYANEELEDLIGLLDSDAYVDEKTGALTSQGAAYIALISNEMDNYKQSIADYTEAVAKLNDELDSGLITQVQYNEYLEDYLSEIRSSISSVDGLRDSLIDLYKEQMQTEVDALQETIDKRKEALEAKKEYVDYDKDIKNSQKTVNALKAQIAALEGVTNATGRAKLKSLQAELAEAEEDLQDKKDEHKYTIQVEGLETMSDDLQDDLDDTLYAITMNAEKQEEIIQNMLNNCVSMYAEAYKEIESIITNTGLILKDSLSNPDAIFDIVMNELTKTKDKTAGSYVRSIDTSNILYDNSSEKLAASILYDQLGHELGTLRSTLKSMGYYKTGTRNATAGVHKVNELGDELIFRYGGDDYTVLSKGDAVLPANLTNRIFDFATDPAKFIANNMPQGITNSSNNIIQVNYDRLVNIEGDATLDTVDAIQAMMPQITDQITKTLTKEYRKLH